jgi:hypothetical protein
MSYYTVATLEEPMEERAELSNLWIEQRPRIVVNAETGVVTFDLSIEAPLLGAQTIPDSFWNALADFHAGRVVDDQIALNQPPPGV